MTAVRESYDGQGILAQQLVALATEIAELAKNDPKNFAAGMDNEGEPFKITDDAYTYYNGNRLPVGMFVACCRASLITGRFRFSDDAEGEPTQIITSQRGLSGTVVVGPFIPLTIMANIPLTTAIEIMQMGFTTPFLVEYFGVTPAYLDGFQSGWYNYHPGGVNPTGNPDYIQGQRDGKTAHDELDSVPDAFMRKPVEEWRLEQEQS